MPQLTLEEVQSLYERLFSEPKLLQEGGVFLDRLIQEYSNFLSETTRLVITPELPQQLRLNAGVVLRNLVLEYWQSNQQIQPQRKVCRELLLNGLVLNCGNMPIISCLTHIIVAVIQIDPSHIWPNPLLELLNWMDDMNATESGLELFLQMFQQFDNQGTTEATNLLKEIVPFILEKGFSIFAQPELSEPLREKILLLIYQVFRSISYADGTDNHLVNRCLDNTFQIWMSLFLSALQTSPKSHIFIKKLVLKILIVIFRDFAIYSRKSLQISLIPIWKFFNSITSLYVAHNVYSIDLDQTDELFNSEENKKLKHIIQQKNAASVELKYLNDDDEYDNHIEGLCAYAIELITILVTKPGLYNLIKFGTFPLLNTLSTFLLATKQQEKQWLREPGYFMQNDEEELIQKSVRTLSLKLINDIIEKYGDQFIQQILMVSERLILNREDKEFLELTTDVLSKLNFQELKGAQQKEFDFEAVMAFMRASLVNVQNTYYKKNFLEKRKEAGYLLLGNFSEDIIVFQSKHSSTFDIKKCIQNILIELHRRENIFVLQSRALWCTTRYADLIAFQFKELFVPLLELSALFCKPTLPLTLKLISAKGIGCFAQKIDKFSLVVKEEQQELYQTYIERGLIDNLLQILQEIPEEQISLVLEALINLIKLSNLFAQELAIKGSKILLQFFSVFHSEQQIIKPFNDLIIKSAQYKEAYAPLFEVFCPFILDCFQVFYNELVSCGQDKQKIKQSDIGLMTAIMSLTSSFVKYCSEPKAQETLITLLPSMVNLILINEDSQLQVHTSQCLKNFIIIETGQILKMNLVNDVMKVNLKLLEVPQNSALESASLFSGNLVMITINNLLKGNPDIPLLKAVVFKIFRSRMPSTVQPLVLVYARMINQNPKESIAFLTSWSIDNRMALKVLIDKWLLQQPLFRGRATKNVTFSALIKLFLLKDKTLENLLVIGYNPSHQNINSDVYAPFKILSLLIRCLDYELTPLRQDSKEYNGDERMEADQEDDDYNNEKTQKQINELYQQQETNQIDVDLEKIKDEDDQDIAERFNLIGHRDKGLADLETGSTLYMSEFLDFNQEVGEECDETTEEDLNYLQDPCVNINLVDMLKEFFNDLIKNDPEYYKYCLRHLLKEDILLLNKHIKLRIN